MQRDVRGAVGPASSGRPVRVPFGVPWGEEDLVGRKARCSFLDVSTALPGPAGSPTTPTLLCADMLRLLRARVTSSDEEL